MDIRRNLTMIFRMRSALNRQTELFGSALVVAGMALSCGFLTRPGRCETSQQDREPTGTGSAENFPKRHVAASASWRDTRERPVHSCVAELVRESWVISYTPWILGTPGGSEAALRFYDCQAGPDCENEGRCVGRRCDGSACHFGCYRATEESCRNSEECDIGGLCSLSGKFCVAASNEDCRPMFVCRELGQCSAIDGRCVAATDAECRASSGCGSDGACTARDGICLAGDSEDCKDAFVCTEYGRCHACEGACFALGDADCMGYPCNHLGLCHWERGTCRALSDVDCEGAATCRDSASRRCKAGGGECVTILEIEYNRWERDIAERPE